MKTDLLTVQDVRKSFPIVRGILRRPVGEVVAVDRVNFTLTEGQILGIVGESGSGKTTVARMILRLLHPTHGTIAFQGNDIFSLQGEALKNYRMQVQMVFQDPFASLNPRLSIRDALSEALRYYKMGDADWIEEQVETVVRQVGLSPDCLRLYPHELSGGQQQRICIARALVLRPKLLLLDEAVSALDVSVSAQVLNLLLELKETFSLSYLFISHNLAVVRYLADQIVVMQGGSVVETGGAEEIFSDPKHPYTQELIAATK